MTSIRRYLSGAALGLLCGVASTNSPAFDGNAEIGKGKIAVCVGCHGADGNGVGGNPLFPKLAGQIPEYLFKQMKDFKQGVRKDPVMAPMVAALTDSDMRHIAAYYAEQKLLPGQASSQTLADQGQKIYRGGNASTGVSACMSCHGPSGHGIPPNFPRVSGQHAAYTEKQLMSFKSSRRANDGEIMTRICFRMSEQEIKAVSEYMAGLH